MTTLTILRLLPELLSLNGSLGNAEVLATRLRWWGVDVAVVDAAAGTTLPGTRPHAIVIGHGTSSLLVPAASALGPWREKLTSWRDEGVPFLGIGLGGDLLGHSVRPDPDSDAIPGVGLTTVRSTLQGPRASLEVVGVDSLGREVAGYLNDQTIRESEHEPSLIRFSHALPEGWRGGRGEGVEGLILDSVVTTALSGPVLALNPALADDIIDTMVTGTGLARPDATERHVTTDEAASMARARIRQRRGLR